MAGFRSTITINGTPLGNALTELLAAEDIAPGDSPSYELCKTIWTYHPLGKKMVETPVELAQSQARDISVPGPAEDRIAKQFRDQWEKDDADGVIANLVSTARAYGIASLGMMVDGVDPSEAIDWKKLPDLSISFSIFDPLNTAGSLVLNQNPLAMDFQKVTAITVAGKPFHRSRFVTMMHEKPIYIQYTTSGFGFVGRSVFQRALFPLKSYVQSMVTDDLVTKKAGVFIAMLSAAGAIIDAIMQASAGMKRLFVQQSTNGNVISIGKDEKIETLNMQNIDGAYGMARTNILDNIAISADMPAIILKEETFVEGFGEGTEDAKKVARWVDRVRRQMGAPYRFMDNIVQRRAWTPEFFDTLKNDFPEAFGGMSFEEFFYQCVNRFMAIWPNLLAEPDSEKVKTDDVKLKGIIATVEVFGPMMDPENKATLIGWAQDNINENKVMFQTPLMLDLEALAEYEPPVPGAEGEGGEEGGGGPKEPEPPRPFHDAAAPRLPRMDESELRELVARVTDELPEILERMDSSAPDADAPPVPGPKRDRAAYMRGYRARQREEGESRVDAGTFKESEHPRGQPENAGQFGSGGGGASAKAKPGARTEAPGARGAPSGEKETSTPAKGGKAGGDRAPSGEEKGAPAKQPSEGKGAAAAGKREKRMATASKLYQAPTKTGNQIIADYGPEAAQAIVEVRKKLEQMIPTDAPVEKGGFTRPDGTYTPERQKVHEELIAKVFTSAAVAGAMPAPGEKPVVTVLGGRGGSGKSWITSKDGPVDPKKSILLDSDHFKSQLPGYEGWNAAQFHEESTDIISLADRRAAALGVNVILDGTLKSEGSIATRMARYETAGFEVEGYYMYASPETAATRALSRFAKNGTFTGRFVPPEVILENTNNEKNFDKLSGGMRKWAVYDNSHAAGPQLVDQSDDEGSARDK